MVQTIIYGETTNKKTNGMAFIEAMKRKEKDEGFEELNTPNTIVGAFGIVGDDGRAHNLYWSVNGSRKDKRHGVLDKPVPQSKYTASLFDSMFKGWN